MNVYGVEGPPPFEGERYVLHLPVPLAEAARAAGIGEPELLRRLERGRRALLEARERRKRPLSDDKVLTDWNGLMIAALARAGTRLAEPRYLDAARRAASFVLETLADPATGTLLHSWRDGRAHVPAFLDDYAFLIQGLLELHEASGEPEWVEEAVRLAEEQQERLGRRGRRLLRRGRRPPAAVPGQAGLRRGAGVRQRRLGAEPDRAGAADRRARLRGSRGGGAARLRRRHGPGAARARDAGPGARALPAARATGGRRTLDPQPAGERRLAAPRPAAPAAATLEEEAEDAVEISGQARQRRRGRLEAVPSSSWR